MSDIIKCLYLEDDQKSFERYSRYLKVWWKHAIGSEIVFEHVKTVTEVIEKLDAPIGSYQIFISDILLPPMGSPNEKNRNKHEPTGINAIKYASKKERILIIGLSVGEDKKQSTFAKDATDAGAHIFHYIGELFDERGVSIKEFCLKVNESLIQKGIIEDPIPLKYDIVDPRIVHIVNEIGSSKIKSLYIKVFSTYLQIKELNASYIAPGMSGAYILRIKAQLHNMSYVNHILKVSSNKVRLDNERKRCPKAGPYANRLFISYFDNLANVDEWYAIGAIFDQNTISLQQWLRQKETIKDVNNVLTTLFFSGGLKEGYLNSIDEKEFQGKSAVKVIAPNPSRSARIIIAMKELEPVILSERLVGVKDWKMKADILKKYLIYQQLASFNEKETPRSCVLCQCHGDLHTRNVLVTTVGAPAPIIIDWSDLDMHHWAIDYARLMVDLLLSVYDYGIHSYEWSHLHDWSGLALQVINNTKLSMSSSNGNHSVVDAINWLIKNLSNICPAVENIENYSKRKWELQLALAVEFMRGAYRLDLTAPKRVFGLISSYNALIESEKSLILLKNK